MPVPIGIRLVGDGRRCNKMESMDRTDFIKSRADVVHNIATLYSYLDGGQGDACRDWAVGRMVGGKNFVVEYIGSRLCFAPSRFVGYIDNTKDKHEANHGSGTKTDERIRAYYSKVQDDRLDALLQGELAKYGASSGKKKYWIPKDTTVDDVVRSARAAAPYTPPNADFDKLWHIQMYLPDGKGGVEIDSRQMLLEKEPVIGTGEWDDVQCRNFKEIDCGNIVLVRKGCQAIALCQIIGENFTDEGLRKKYLNINYRKVKILAWADEYRQPRAGLFSQKTFSSCGRNTEQYKYIHGWLEYMENKAFTDRCARLLKAKHNIILQGAPGTGKTYNTAAIALGVLGIGDVDLTDHEAVMGRYGELQDKRIFFTTFHQSLDYEDFVEGLKPRVQTNADGESIGVCYEPEDGIFKRACKAAEMGKTVVLIIDEINRGNVSKIFGELITLLESDKRDNGSHPIKVTLPYSKAPFGVPGGLYIIGTMNTTDRSTGTLDYALRRRFAFVTLRSDPSVIEKHYDALGAEDLKDKALGVFDDIKAFITSPKHLCGDLGIDDLMVGHSYFLASSEEELRDKMEYEIIPLVAEYINDGILCVDDEEKGRAFCSWGNLQPMPMAGDEEDDEEDGGE